MTSRILFLGKSTHHPPAPRATNPYFPLSSWIGLEKNEKVSTSRQFSSAASQKYSLWGNSKSCWLLNHDCHSRLMESIEALPNLKKKCTVCFSLFSREGPFARWTVNVASRRLSPSFMEHSHPGCWRSLCFPTCCRTKWLPPKYLGPLLVRAPPPPLVGCSQYDTSHCYLWKGCHLFSDDTILLLSLN